MKYDLIIPTKTSPRLIPVTQQTIDTARQDGADINIVLIESGEDYQYSGVDKYLKYEGTFCYNRALNMGLREAVGDVHILANNDIIFHKGWSQIGDLMRLNGYHSASALAGHLIHFNGGSWFEEGDHVYEGYKVGYILTGWCLFVDRFCTEKIGLLDETVNFWYSDDLYAAQIKAAGIEHALFCNIRVDHLCSQTLNKEKASYQRNLQIGQLGKFIKRRQQYAEGKRINTVNPKDL